MVEKRLVWDLPLRLFHWLLVLSIAASWYTAERSEDYLNIGSFSAGYIQIHFWLGYWTLGMIIFRVIWGFVGPRHARFSNFMRGPSKTAAYIRSFGSRDYVPAPGHNPLGAWSVVLLLSMIAAQAITGLFLVDNTEIYLAPYHQTVDPSTASRFATFHFTNFDVLLWAIGLHVLAVLFYVFAKRQNLIGAMLSGRKPGHLVSEQEAITGSQVLKALIVIAIAAGAVWLLLELAPPIVYEDEY
jgi:cytochrome b